MTYVKIRDTGWSCDLKPEIYPSDLSLTPARGRPQKKCVLQKSAESRFVKLTIRQTIGPSNIYRKSNIRPFFTENLLDLLLT